MNRVGIKRGLVTILAMAMVLPVVFGTVVSKPYERPEQFIVGFRDDIDVDDLEEAGGIVERVITEFSLAVVLAYEPREFVRQAERIKDVVFVETDDGVYPSGAAPDGSTWDGSTWDASTWDGSTWDGSTWDASTWDGSTWDGSTWDGSTWDGSTWDGSTWDGSTWDASTWDGSTWDGGVAGLPKPAAWTYEPEDQKPKRDDRHMDRHATPRIASAGEWGAEDPLYRTSWGLGAVNAPDAWHVNRGAHGTIICVLDTGVDPDHPDLKPNLWRENGTAKVFTAMLRNPDPRDDVGHGTHVAGIAAAVAGNGWGATGLGQHTILSIKVMDRFGGTESDVAEGLKECTKAGASVVTLSLHVTEDSRALRRSIEKTLDRGVAIVAAVGNEGGRAGVNLPAAYPGVIGVGAVGPDGNVAGFSNQGSQVDVVAPGVHVVSTFRDGGFAYGSGTSQAVPFVASALALARDLAPDKPMTELTELMYATARSLDGTDHHPRSGHGVLDVGAFLTAVSVAGASAESSNGPHAKGSTEEADASTDSTTDADAASEPTREAKPTRGKGRR